MKIINLAKNVILAEDAVVADTALSRMIGLLGRGALRKGEALILRPCNQIHTFFMRFPIDVLFVDKNNRVIAAISNLQPYRATPIYFSASSVIELPAGSIQTSLTSTGDTLLIKLT